MIIGHSLNQQKQFMHQSYNRKIDHFPFSADNSMNDDSFLHQLLHNHKFHNQFEINIQTDRNVLSFGKPHQTQNFIPSSLPVLGKNKKTSVQQVLKRDSSERQSTNLSLASRSNENIHDEQIHSPSCEQKIIDFRRKQSHQYEQKQKTVLEQKKKQRQRFLQEQKQKLQKLREENQKFIESKKQKDQKINEFKNELKNLNKIKQKQIIKSQQNIKLLQAQEHRKNEKKFYEAMMQQKLAINKLLSEKQIQERQRMIIEQEQSGKKVMEVEKKIVKPKLCLEQTRKDAQQRKKINEIRDFLKKRSSCQQKVSNQQFKVVRQPPNKRVNQQSNMNKKSSERRLHTKSLSASQIYRMGQQFMQQAHLLISPELIERSKMQFDKRRRQMGQGSRTEYSNYLKESKARRTMLAQSIGIKNEVAEIRELRQLIVKEQNSAQKLLKAKLISSRLDTKQQAKKCTRLKIDSIAAKLKIIQEFS